MKKGIVAALAGLIITIGLFAASMFLMNWIDLISTHSHSLLQTDISDVLFLSFLLFSLVTGGGIAALIKDDPRINLAIILLLITIFIIISGGLEIYSDHWTKNITSYLIILIGPFLGSTLVKSIKAKKQSNIALKTT
jgi:hypothetical protein